MGIKAAYSPKQSIWDEDWKEMGMDIPAGSIPPWTGLDCGCSSYPCFHLGTSTVVPLSLQSVGSGSTSADRQNYCMFSEPCSQHGKVSQDVTKFLGAYRLDCCHVHIVLRA